MALALQLTTLFRDPMSKRVVAIIEDDLSLRTSLVRLLRTIGYVCETWRSTEEFLDRLAISKANCVLIDIDLGDGLLGIELCKRLRASGRTLNIIVMTGVDGKQNEIKAAEAGCNAYLHKPFSFHALIGAIEKRAG
jgi:FixJ family two-component response regulator